MWTLTETRASLYAASEGVATMALLLELVNSPHNVCNNHYGSSSGRFFEKYPSKANIKHSNNNNIDLSNLHYHIHVYKPFRS